MIKTIVIWFQHNRFVKLNVSAFVTLPLVLLFVVYNFGKYVHLIVVESVHVTREVVNVEGYVLVKLEVGDFKHKPKGVTSSIGIWFHEKIILINVLNIH